MRARPESVVAGRLTLHVPEALNDGSPVCPSQFEAYEAALIDLAGGFTLLPAIGAWRSQSGQIYREPMRLYAIDVADVDATMPVLHKLVRQIGADLAQEAIYVSLTPALADVVPLVPQSVLFASSEAPA